MDRFEAAFETVFDPARGDCLQDPDAVLILKIVNQEDRLALCVRFRTEAFDAAYAKRFADYHLTALANMVADPESRHCEQSLLSTEELHFQIEGLAGPRRKLPDRRFHELFEQRVAARPDVTAAVCGDRSWTCRELNARANRLGRALLERGLQPEGVVAVVTERNLDWMAAVLAVFKAGGVYLPIEPHFPTDRIANMLSRAGCRLAVTEPGSDAALDQALERFPRSAEAFCRRRLRREPQRRKSRGRCGAWPSCVHLLHFGLHRRSQGGVVRARGLSQSPLRQGGGFLGSRRGRRSPKSLRSASTSRFGNWWRRFLWAGARLLSNKA